jgi:hypothetical protein
MELEELSCPECRLGYDTEMHIPCILSCGHTYCKTCILSLASSDTIRCPEDNFTTLYNSISGVPTNFALLHILKKLPCKKKSLSHCEVHNRPLDFACMDDKKKICSACAIVGGHKGHAIKLMEDLMKEVTLRAECLIDMLQIIEKTQTHFMDKDILPRLDRFYEKYCRKKQDLERLVREGFENLIKKLQDVEKKSLTALQKNFEYIEGNIVNIRDMPKLIDSQANAWKNRVKSRLDFIEKHSDDPSKAAFEIVDSSCTELFNIGEKLLVDLEELKDLKVEPLEVLMQGLDVEFEETILENICRVKALPKLKKMPCSETKSNLPSEDSVKTDCDTSTSKLDSNEDNLNTSIELEENSERVDTLDEKCDEKGKVTMDQESLLCV